MYHTDNKFDSRKEMANARALGAVANKRYKLRRARQGEMIYSRSSEILPTYRLSLRPDGVHTHHHQPPASHVSCLAREAIREACEAPNE